MIIIIIIFVVANWIFFVCLHCSIYIGFCKLPLIPQSLFSLLWHCSGANWSLVLQKVWISGEGSPCGESRDPTMFSYINHKCGKSTSNRIDIKLMNGCGPSANSWTLLSYTNEPRNIEVSCPFHFLKISQWLEHNTAPLFLVGLGPVSPTSVNSVDTKYV